MPIPTPKRFSTGTTGGHLRWKKQEKEAAKSIGGATTPGSGSGSIHGDVRKKRAFRVECKATNKASFSLTRAMVDKLQKAALQSSELPMILVDFVDDRGKVEHSLCVLPRYAYEMIAGEIA